METTKKVRPTQWAKEQKWRKLHPGDADQARALYSWLHFLGLYPTSDLEGPDYAAQIANSRAALQDIIPELKPADLVVLYQVGRLLLLAT